MLHELTLYEVLEIHELLAFKKASLIKGQLFLETVAGQKYIVLLKDDIDFSIQEIDDLQNLLLLPPK